MKTARIFLCPAEAGGLPIAHSMISFQPTNCQKSFLLTGGMYLMKKLFKNIAKYRQDCRHQLPDLHRRLPPPRRLRQRRRGLYRYRRQGADRRRSGRPGAGRSVRCAERHGHAHRDSAHSGDVRLRRLMHWAQALVFCGGLAYAAVDDLRSRTVNDAVCIAIAVGGADHHQPRLPFGGAAGRLSRSICVRALA